MHLEILNPWKDFAAVKQTWEKIVRPAEVGYFLSWGWIETWLNSLKGKKIDLNLYVLGDNADPVFCFFLSDRFVNRKKIISSRTLFLNTTGVPVYDDLWIEYNTIPGAGRTKLQLLDLLSHLPRHWDEIVLPGFDEASWPESGLRQAAAPYRIIIDRDEPAPYVDLAKVRAAPGGYLSLLGKKTRSHIRQSLRAYEKTGRIELNQASDLDSALEMYDELIIHHQQAWAARGRPGAFTSLYFQDFHRQLIGGRFASGEIQLLRVRCGKETVGCLYNFIHNGIVHNYQSGINYRRNKQLQSGLICLSEAIVHNAGLGHAAFDFMAGDSGYKRRMSTDEKRVLWARIQKPRLKFNIEDSLAALYKRLRGGFRAPQ